LVNNVHGCLYPIPSISLLFRASISKILLMFVNHLHSLWMSFCQMPEFYCACGMSKKLGLKMPLRRL
jgi:hypothetical protein